MSLRVDIQRNLKGFALELAFSMESGRLGILGASGCGKSMTLRCIAGIDTPDAGHISTGDRMLFDSAKKVNLKPQQRKVGYLFQSYALFPNMTVAQNILCSLPKGDHALRLGEIISLLQLDGLEQRRPSQLSGGQQQRVALARILMYDPELLLLDEPFAAMDSHLKEELQLQLLDIFSHFDKNVVLVTHNRDEIYKLCDTLLVMDAGRMVKIGNARQMFSEPEMLQVARLTGCKNISLATKIDAHTLYARDWGVRLQSSQPVSDDVTHVGIRAHDFIPIDDDDDVGEVNIFEVEALRRAEDPFESNVIFVCKGVEGEIWWKFARQADRPMPARLRVDASNVLPLKDDQ